MSDWKAGMAFDSVLQTPLDYYDVTYANGHTVRYEKERPHGEWIPCSERLPDEMGDYLVTEKISDIEQAVYTSSFGHIRTGELCFYYEDDECIAIKNEGIVAWMPLPEPYKRGEAE